MLQEGYAQSKGKLFCVPSPSGEEGFMIPVKYVKELQRLTRSNWPMRSSVNLGQDNKSIETLLCGRKGSRSDHVPKLNRFGEIHS